MNDISKSGYYTISEGSANGGFVGYLHQFKQDDNWVYQQAASFTTTNLASYLYRQKWRNNWLGWEWLNPPGGVNQDWATVFRFNEKVVYSRLMYLGSAASEKVVNHNVSGQIIAYFGTIADLPLPVNRNANYNAFISVSSTDIRLVETGYDGHSVYVQLFWVPR